VSVSVCLFVCLSAIISPDYTSDLHEFFVHVTYGRVSAVICCILPVLWMTSYLHISARRRRTAEAQLTRSLGLGYKRRVGIPAAGNERTELLLAVGLGGSSGGGVGGLRLPC